MTSREDKQIHTEVAEGPDTHTQNLQRIQPINSLKTKKYIVVSVFVEKHFTPHSFVILNIPIQTVHSLSMPNNFL